MTERPRYLPGRAFPAYAFVPGRNPHPVTDPQGHSFGAERPVSPPLTVAGWRRSDNYLWGTDLYNHGYPWEAHEAWEGLWRQAGRGSTVHAHLQGLIQCAAAVVKAKSGQAVGVTRLGETALVYLQTVVDRAGSPYLGIDLAVFMSQFRGYVAAQPFAPEAWPIIRLSGFYQRAF